MRAGSPGGPCRSQGELGSGHFCDELFRASLRIRKGPPLAVFPGWERVATLHGNLFAVMANT